MILALQTARFITAVCGIRSGKTHLLLFIILFWATTRGKPDNIGVISTQNFTAGEDNIIQPMYDFWPEGVIRSYSADKHRMILANGHKLRFISGVDGDSAKGLAKVAYAAIDEAVLQPEWVMKVLRGRVIDLQGPILITTTPSGKQDNAGQFVPTIGLNWVKKIYKRGFNPKYGNLSYNKETEQIDIGNTEVPWDRRYFSWNMSTWDNPHIPIEEKEGLLDDYSANEYASEILGRFPDIDYEVFNESDFDPDKIGYLEEELDEFHLEHFMIIDPAWSEQKIKTGCESAILIGGVAPDDEHGRLGIYIRESWAGKVGPAELETIIISKAREYGITKAGCENVGAATLMDNIKRAQTLEVTFRVISLGTKNQDKRTRASGVPPYLENRLLKFPVDEYGNFINGTDKLVTQAILFTGKKREPSDRVDTMSYIFHPDMNLVKGYKKPGERKTEQKQDTVMSHADYRRYQQRGRRADTRKAGALRRGGGFSVMRGVG